ncbi:TetR/AcrR family transcriptional regulator [Phytoactinopolyspora mesophila]|uniref:TetR family transcriptional regulator n=1 Tax=Phytoactinopolyspora mesophila TaxID=2650750 RepID=A0A7K3M3L8_9ACTN|nr:TetR/AcrR family transcriptional regulator [Phytoactinopolyspora mesophila]NDL57921.1 TetR family transcriptional regulator [Phytoactinopolyspora mesophila]
MVRNPERRTTLLNAAIDVLAAQGARGLTFRAVDTAADVPVGTTSNYFPNRDELLRQAGEHVFVRLTPDDTTTAALLDDDRDRDHERRLMQDLLRRAEADRAGYLAMFELRLEAVRRPELRAAFTRGFRANLEQIVQTHVDGGFPGNRTTAVLLYVAMSGLLLEHLTLPGVLGEEHIDEVVAALVETIVPG